MCSFSDFLRLNHDIDKASKDKTLPANFRISPEHHLIFSRYFGTVVIEDYIDIVEGVISHPDFDIHQKHLIDLTHLEKLKRNYLKMMMIQARLADLVAQSRSDILHVIVAPNPVAIDAAKTVLKSWDRLETKVIGRVVRNLDEAATLLGLSEKQIYSLKDEIPIHDKA